MSMMMRSRSRSGLELAMLKPAARAFALGYLTITLPKLVSFVKTLQRRDLSTAEKLQRLARILHCGLKWDRFPTFCALLAGGSSIFPAILTSARSKSDRKTTIRFIVVFMVAWLCFPLLNRSTPKHNVSVKCNGRTEANGTHEYNPTIANARAKNDDAETNSKAGNLSGRTLDLTLFSATRAADALINVLWATWKRKNGHTKTAMQVQSFAPKLADTSVFAFSCAIVMWAWFYLPNRLPYSYGKWISEAAQLDDRILNALRTARRGDWTYGRDNGDQLVLEPMCADYGWPIEWGCPEKTVPIPCEIVHMGCGPSCEKAAVWHFTKAFRFAFATYLPLQIVLRCRSRNIRAYIQAVKSAVRSSVFLGLFVSSFYYSVCLARTRLGPRLFSSKTITPMMWDSGLCVAAGCATCGWSIFVESAGRRQEINLFVAPKALATLLPREYNRKYQWREKLAFSLSAAVLVACIQENPKLVRGVFGRLLARVFKA